MATKLTKAQKPGWMRSKATWIVAGSAFILVVGTTAIANAATPHAPASAPVRFAAEASASSTPTPSPTPVIEVTTVTVDEPVPFAATTVDDPGSDAGTTTVTTAGRNGVNTKTYRVTIRDGVETGRTLVSEAVTTPPVAQVTSVGSRQPAPPPAPPAAAPPAAAPPAAEAPSGCDPNYSGACVPIAGDVDCAGGSGNGPAYVQGPVQVIGSDIYDLDRDGDGVACE